MHLGFIYGDCMLLYRFTVIWLILAVCIIHILLNIQDLFAISTAIGGDRSWLVNVCDYHLRPSTHGSGAGRSLRCSLEILM